MPLELASTPSVTAQDGAIQLCLPPYHSHREILDRRLMVPSDQSTLWKLWRKKLRESDPVWSGGKDVNTSANLGHSTASSSNGDITRVYPSTKEDSIATRDYPEVREFQEAFRIPGPRDDDGSAGSRK